MLWILGTKQESCPSSVPVKTPSLRTAVALKPFSGIEITVFTGRWAAPELLLPPCAEQKVRRSPARWGTHLRVGSQRCWQLIAGLCPIRAASAIKAQLLHLVSYHVSFRLFCYWNLLLWSCLKHYYRIQTAVQRLSFHGMYSSPSCNRTHFEAASKTYLHILSYWHEPAWLLPHVGGMRGQETTLFFAHTRLLQCCTGRTRGGGVGGKFLTTQSSVIWAQQRGASRTKHVWNQVSAKSLHISSLSRLLTRHKWKRTIRQQKEGRVSIVYIDLIKYLSKACDHWQYALWPNNRLHINNGFFFFFPQTFSIWVSCGGGRKERKFKKENPNHIHRDTFQIFMALPL